jgi:diaminohydroxyphosphoribosylaminopyrimidine deaminase/5-amino-6-(5-phosphoribosylamino)uracil reductase
LEIKNSEQRKIDLMKRAIFLAEKAQNHSPNPRVGAIILNRGQIVGSGFHERAGDPHAEILAILKAGTKARGGELFVTLEPCNHFGRTPPCSRAILKSGIRKVFVGMLDPTTAGGGAKFLAENGIAVTVGIAESECRELNRIWLRNVGEKMPFVAVKMALDERGSTIPAAGKKWISSAKSRRAVMRMRREFDAVAVGVGTIVADDPRLNVRGIRCDRQPVRIIFDPNLRTPKTAKVLKNSGKTILISRAEFPDFDLRKILRKLFDRGIRSIFLEGGETTVGKFLNAKLVDEVFIFQKGNLAKTKIWQKIRLKKIGEFDGDGIFFGRKKKN